MTALTQWNPFAEMEAMQNRLSSWLDWAPVRAGSRTPANETWSPLVDVVETGDRFVIRADLPGVAKEDVSVKLEQGQLTIEGQRSAEPLAEGAQYVFDERPFGTFTRTFLLPSWAEASHIHADFRNGVLTVTVEKAEQAKARSIPIEGD